MCIEGPKPEEAFFCCNLGEIIKKHREWVGMPRVKPFYAVKCNDNDYVLKFLLGLEPDLIVPSELEKVITLGVHPSRIIYANPTKQETHIRAAKQMNVSVMTFDNIFELHKIKMAYPTGKLLLRFNCDSKQAIRLLGMKFGAFATAHELGLDVAGISFHVGSGCMEPSAFQRGIEQSKWLFSLGAKYGFKMRILDIGGGFPGATGSDITDIGKIVNNSLDIHFPEGCGVEIIAEPGRSYVASAFKLLTQIHSKREGKSDNGEKLTMYFINDGLYGSLKYYHHVGLMPTAIQANGDDDDMPETLPSSMWGPTCDGLDQVCERIMLPKMDMGVGDWLLFDDMGAYSISVAGKFNGFPVPRVAYVATAEAWEALKDILPALKQIHMMTKRKGLFMSMHFTGLSKFYTISKELL